MQSIAIWPKRRRQRLNKRESAAIIWPCVLRSPHDSQLLFHPFLHSVPQGCSLIAASISLHFCFQHSMLVAFQLEIACSTASAAQRVRSGGQRFLFRVRNRFLPARGLTGRPAPDVHGACSAMAFELKMSAGSKSGCLWRIRQSFYSFLCPHLVQ